MRSNIVRPENLASPMQLPPPAPSFLLPARLSRPNLHYTPPLPSFSPMPPFPSSATASTSQLPAPSSGTLHNQQLIYQRSQQAQMQKAASAATSTSQRPANQPDASKSSSIASTSITPASEVLRRASHKRKLNDTAPNNPSQKAARQSIDNLLESQISLLEAHSLKNNIDGSCAILIKAKSEETISEQTMIMLASKGFEQSVIAALHGGAGLSNAVIEAARANSHTNLVNTLKNAQVARNNILETPQTHVERLEQRNATSSLRERSASKS